MALSQSPKIVTDGLVFYYDINNVQKSWRGAPTTNLATNVNLGFSGDRWTNVSALDYPNKNSMPFNLLGPVWKLSSGNNYLGFASDFNITAGNTYTLSCWYYVNTVQTINWLNDVWNNGYASVVSSVASNTFINTNNTNGWRYGSKTFTISGGSSPFYVRGTSSTLGDGNPTGSVYIANFQIEQNSLATSYVNGTRSNTQAVLDLMNNIPLTVENLTYNSSGTFSFNGTSSRVLSSSPVTINYSNGGTFEMVFRSADIATPRAQGYMQHNNGGTGNYVNFYSSTNKMRWEVIGNGLTAPYGWNGDRVLSNNTWYHAVGTFSSGGITRLYINGTLDKQVTQTVYPRGDVTASIVIGEYSGYMSGDIPMCKIYNRSLSEAEVFQNFSAIRGRYGL